VPAATDTAADESPSRAEALLRRPLVAALACLGGTLLLTWPLAARLGSALPAGAGDLWQNLWNFWWWGQALAAGESPWWTPLQFHPRGADLALHTHSPFNMLLFARIAEPATAYGLAVLFSTWLAAFGAYLLGRELSGSARAGLVAALVFAFFPNRLEQTLEHLNLFSTQFLPLTVWAYLRLVRQGGLRWVLALGGFFAANALCDWQLATLGLLLLAVLGVATLWRPPRPRAALARDLGLAGAVAVGLTLPAAWPVVEAVGSGQAFQKPAVEKGVDLAFLLRPHFHHPLWGDWTLDAYRERRAYPSAGFTAYLGLVPLLLAGVAVARRRAGAAFWAGLFGASLVLALGAHAHLDGRLLRGVTLPFAWFEPLPVLSTLRVANRFLIPASLALAVLAALGAGRRASDVRFAGILLVVALDYLWLPYPLAPLETSALYAKLRAGAAPGAVLNVPFTDSPGAVGSLRAQIGHGRPIAGGYVSVPSPETRASIANEPALADLYGLAPRLARPVDRERLVALGFGVILLHKDRRAGWRPPDGESAPVLGAALYRLGEMSAAHFDAARSRIEAACGAPFYEDERLAAFRLRPEASAPSR
jgi:hypothetical protein